MIFLLMKIIPSTGEELQNIFTFLILAHYYLSLSGTLVSLQLKPCELPYLSMLFSYEEIHNSNINIYTFKLLMKQMFACRLP